MKYVYRSKILLKALPAVISICMVMSFAGISIAQNGPFEHLADSATAFFTPMDGNITSISEKTVTSDLGSEKGVQIGMRFEISREGAPFIHPVTKEQIGILESHVGRAEVIAATEGSSTLRVLSGTPAQGDVIRVTSALVRTLFFQSSDVDWNVSQEYYDTLQDTNRFELIDTAPGVMDEDKILAEARNEGAEIALILTSAKKGEDLILKQRLLWVEDGQQLSADLAPIGPALLADLRLGSELFTPKKAFVISFDVPYSTVRVGAGDINGDGVQELIMASDSSLSFLNVEKSLNPALGGAEYNAPNTEEIIWMDVYDLDGDNADEVVITARKSSRVVSRVLKYKNGKLNKEFSGNHFLRVIDGQLYGQKFIKGIGYDGPVYTIEFGESSKKPSKGNALDLPEGVNIYDFSFIKNPKGERWVLAFDGAGRLNLYDEDNKRVWISLFTYGEALEAFEKTSATPADMKGEDDTTEAHSLEKWTVNDKIHIMGRSAMVIDRAPVLKSVPGVGVKASQVVGLNWMNDVFQEIPMFKDVSGNVKDVAIIDDKVYVLTRPIMGFDTKKLLKGKNPMINKLYIYSLKGI